MRQPRSALAHVVAAAAIALLAACFHPTYDHTACGPSGECPRGTMCSAQHTCEDPESDKPDGACGDGHKGTQEQCDGSDFGGSTCTDFSPPGTANKFYAGGAPACTADCMVNVATCTGGWCGDAHRQFSEECDGNDLGGTTCASLGFPGPVKPLQCTSACSFDPSSCNCGSARCVQNTELCKLVNSVPTCVPAV